MKEIKMERKRLREANLEEFAFFDENDEMVVLKVDKQKVEQLPAGYFRVNRDAPIHKVSKDTTGEMFIKNLEKVNKERVQKSGEEANQHEQVHVTPRIIKV